tara:strand:+ start:103 stop:300 length:198 start_codon:yes stop_codon:yes gene_type:complete
MAVDLLEEKELDHSVVNFQHSQTELLNEVKEAHDWKTVPMIFQREGQNIKFIGGYTDLEKHLENV